MDSQDKQNKNSYKIIPPIKHPPVPVAVRDKLETEKIPYNHCLTAKQAASVLGVHPLTVHRMLKSGKLQGIKDSHFSRAYQWSLDEYRVAHTTAPPEQETEQNKPKRTVKSTSHHLAMRRLERLGI